VRELALELSLIGDEANTDEEKRLAQTYARGLQAYTDAQEVWSAKVSGGKEFSGWELAEALLNKYHIPHAKNDLPLPDLVIQQVWQKGQSDLEAANKVYLSLK
jgi:hypothetical protein